MQLRFVNGKCALALVLAIAGTLLPWRANAASCKTESQMTAAERDALANAARAMAAQVQSGNVQALRDNTLPAVAANFAGIAASATTLKPLVEHASITVDDLYALDSLSEPAGKARTDFYCGTRIVVFNVSNLPPGKYGIAILHATGVAQPQQISLILAQTAANRWMLAGFFTSPMLEDGHNGLWYWQRARDYAQQKKNWDAWFYYQTAAYLLDPLGFLHSPNLDKLQREANQARPSDLPRASPMMLHANGETFQITRANPTTAFGGLDLEVHYAPDPTQLTQLRDPVAARKQAIALMAALLARHPGLRVAYHGIWARADNGNASVYALELPMSQIPGTLPNQSSQAIPEAPSAAAH